MRRALLLLVGLLALAGVAVASSGGATQSQPRWIIRDLGTLGGPSSWAESINERGQVVGWSETARKDARGRFVKHAFLWENGRMRDLGTLGVHEGLEASQALALNERGQVVGETSTSSSERHAFLWERGKMRDLGSLSRGSLSSANAINESGLVLGENEDPDGPDGAVVWRAGRIGALPTDSIPVAVNDRGQVLVEGILGPLNRVARRPSWNRFDGTSQPEQPAYRNRDQRFSGARGRPLPGSALRVPAPVFPQDL